MSPLRNDRIKVLFPEEEEAITPGQAVVFYHGDYVLGGGDDRRDTLCNLLTR